MPTVPETKTGLITLTYHAPVYKFVDHPLSSTQAAIVVEAHRWTAEMGHPNAPGYFRGQGGTPRHALDQMIGRAELDIVTFVQHLEGPPIVDAEYSPDPRD